MKFKSIAIAAIAFTAMGIALPQSASAAVSSTKIHPTNVKVDKSCAGSLKAKLITGINLADKYGKVQGSHKVTVFCDHTMLASDSDGFYSPDRSKVYGDKITVNSKTGFATMVVIHELAHYLDYERYGYDDSMNVSVSAKNEAKRQAIRDADTYTYAWATWATCHTAAVDKALRGWCGYALDDTEIFARGYAQYVATVSGDRTLLKQIKNYSQGYAHWGYTASQGHADDFTVSGDGGQHQSLYGAYSKL